MKVKLDSILLIDDDDATNFISRMSIVKSGITENIAIALNGKEAIEYLTNKGKYERPSDPNPQPSLILLDINMPVMDGWEFLQAYKELGLNTNNRTVIVMLSTSVNPNDELRAAKTVEIAEYLSKPLTVEKLQRITENYFSGNI